MFRYGYFEASYEDVKAIRNRRRTKNISKGDKVVGLDYKPVGIPDSIVGGIAYDNDGLFVTIDYSNGDTFHMIRIPIGDVRKLKNGEDFV